MVRSVAPKKLDKASSNRLMNGLDIFDLPDEIGLNSTRMLYIGHNFEILAAKANDGQSYVIKRPKRNAGTIANILSLRHEYEVLCEIESLGITPACKWASLDGAPALVLEDISAINLLEYFSDSELCLSDRLRLAAKWCKTLATLHAYGIVHGDVDPRHVIVSRESHALYLIDFSRAVRFDTDSEVYKKNDLNEQKLSDLIQANRLQKNQEDREYLDWQGLAKGFSELFNNNRQIAKISSENFDAMQKAETGYWKQVSEAEGQAVLAQIIRKILEKNVDSRYRSVLGIARDLEALAHLIDTDDHAKIKRFVLATCDQPLRIAIPKKIYGRQAHLQKIRDEWTWVKNSGGSSITSLFGPDGVGKSTLMHQFAQNEIKSTAIFSVGKYHDIGEQAPYSGLLQAAVSLIRMISGMTENVFDHWRQRVLKETGENIYLICELIPELTGILGLVSSGERNPFKASQQLVLDSFITFFSTFSEKSRPLILFLDDLQWADSGTFEFIQKFTKSNNSSIMLVLACSDDFLEENNNLNRQVNLIKENADRFLEIKLSNLEFDEIREICRETFFMENDRTDRIAISVYQCCRGNPFLLKQILHQLYREKIVDLDIKNFCFVVDDKRANEFFEMNSGRKIIENKVKSFAENVQNVLSCAAYYGRVFDVDALAEVSGESLNDVERALNLATNEFLLSDVTNHDLMIGNDKHSIEKKLYRFSHDWTATLCKQLLDREIILKQRLSIARLLIGQHQSFKVLSPDESLQIFHALSHFNETESLVTDQFERLRLANLYAEAGERAQAAYAWDIARSMFCKGRKFLTYLPPNIYRSLSRRLMYGEGSCCMLLGEKTNAEIIFTELLSDSKSALESAEVEYARCRLFTSMQRNEEAIRAGLSGLRVLGFTKRQLRSSKIKAYLKLYFCQRRLAKIDFEKIVNLPETKDPEKILVSLLLTETIHPSLLIDPELGVNLSCLQIEFLLKNGMTRNASIAFLYLAVAINGISVLFGTKLWSGNSLHKILRIYEHFAASKMQSDASLESEMVFRVYCGHLMPRVFDVARQLIPLTTRLISRGDQTFASYSGLFALSMGYFSGHHISDIIRSVKNWPDHVFQRGSGPNANYRLFRKSLEDFDQGSVQSLQSLVDDFDKENIYDENNKAFFATLVLQQGVILSLIGKHTEAMAKFWLSLVRGQLVRKFAGNYKVLKCIFFMAVSIGSVFSASSRWNRPFLIFQIIWIRRVLRLYVVMQANNAVSKLAFVDAIYAQIRGKNWSKVDAMYERAIAIAIKNNSHLDLAVASEYFANFLLSRGMRVQASGLISLAISAFDKIGFKFKVQMLQGVQDNHKTESQSVLNNLEVSLNITSDLDYSHNVDVPAVLGFASKLSRQIKFSDLKETILDILFETAAARSVALLWRLNKSEVVGSDLQIIAYRGRDGAKDRHEDMPGTNLISQRVLAHVQSQQNILCIDDVAHDSVWSNDDSMRSRDVRALLCLPVFIAGELQGVIYIENDNSSYAFTSDQVNLIKLLSGQIAISLDNALLYDNLLLALEAEKKARKQEYAAHTAYVSAEKSRRALQLSLEAAEAIQKSLVNCRRNGDAYNVDYLYDPAENTGGDWLGTYEDNQHGWLYICLGDVTGHGISAALVTSAVAGAVVSSIEQIKTIDIELSEALRIIAHSVNCAVRTSGAERDQLMTLALLGIDLNSGSACYLNAGHHPVLSSMGKDKVIFQRSNPLGLVDEPNFGVREFQLEPDMMLAIYSDGLIENRSAAGARLKIRSLSDLMRSASSPSDVITLLRSYVRTLPRGSVLDDTACVVFKWCGSKAA